jgi:hypothetical protein
LDGRFRPTISQPKKVRRLLTSGIATISAEPLIDKPPYYIEVKSRENLTGKIVETAR